MKICSMCKKKLEISLFSNNRSRSDGKEDYCKSCKSAYAKRNNSHAQHSLKVKTNGTWTLEDKKVAFAKQKGKCGLCSAGLANWRQAHADHSENGKRDLLCRRCNTALGFVENGIWLNAALHYITKHRKEAGINGVTSM